MEIKRIAALAILLVLGAYSIYSGMQTMAVGCMCLFIALMYKEKSKKVFDTVVELLATTKQAKWGNLEVILEKKLDAIGATSGSMARKVAWAQAILSTLTAKEIGLLLSISKVERFDAVVGIMGGLRNLREVGLIQHNEPTMAGSTQVWLTDLGKELTEMLLEPDPSQANDSK